MGSHYTRLVPSLELHTGAAHEAGLSDGIWRERMLPHKRKKERNMHCSKHMTAPKSQQLKKYLEIIKQKLIRQPLKLSTCLPCDLVSFSFRFPAWFSRCGICLSLSAALLLSFHVPSVMTATHYLTNCINSAANKPYSGTLAWWVSSLICYLQILGETDFGSLHALDLQPANRS